MLSERLKAMEREYIALEGDNKMLRNLNKDYIKTNNVYIFVA